MSAFASFQLAYDCAYDLNSAGSMFMSCKRSSSDMLPFSTSTLSLSIVFREARSSFGAVREAVVEKGREACVIYMPVSPGHERANAIAPMVESLRRPPCSRGDCHLTFVLFAGPIKERKHLGAAMVAVLSSLMGKIHRFNKCRCEPFPFHR